MCNSCIVCLTPQVFGGATSLLPVLAYCKWQKRSKCYSSVCPDSFPLTLICSSTSATSSCVFPQEAMSLSSISAWCLCVRGLIIMKMILEISPPQPRNVTDPSMLFAFLRLLRELQHMSGFSTRSICSGISFCRVLVFLEETRFARHSSQLVLSLPALGRQRVCWQQAR